MKSTQLSWLSKLKVITGAVSTVLVVGSFAVAQNDFDFSSLPTQQSQAGKSRARIITGQNTGNAQQTRLGELAPLRQDGERHFATRPSQTQMSLPQTGQHSQASSVSPQMTESFGNVRPASHTAVPAVPTRLYRLSNCDWRQFEYNLLSMWIHQPQVQPLEDGQIMRVEIPTSDPNTIGTMLINRKDSSVYFEGEDHAIAGWNEVVRELDREQIIDDVAVRMIRTAGLTPSQIQKVNYMVRVKQQDDETMRAVQLPGVPQDQGNEVGGPVEARIIPGVGTMILKGNEQDVADLEEQIKRFLEAAQAAQPQPKRFDLTNADPVVAAETLQTFYDAQLAETQGPASIAPMQNPKGLLVVAKGPALKLIEKIILELDKDKAEDPQDTTRDFKVYRLEHISSIDAQQRVNEYFGRALDSGVSGEPSEENVLTIADPRANLLIVKAAPSYIQKVDQLIETLDIAESGATREIRLIKLRNTEASLIAPVIQAAINGRDAIVPNGNQQQQQLQNQNQDQQGPASSTRPQTMLQMLTVDREGNAIRSGIVFDVQITADSSSNSLIVRAPADSMPLIEALAARLDVVPDVETQIKVFQILNGDATTLIEMLNTLFGAGTQVGGQQGGVGGATGVTNLPLQSASATDGQSLANLRFTLDERTNSIIASGPVGDLEVVKNLLTRLDEDDVNRRQVTVVRLNNAYAVDVSDAINSWLDERTALVTDNFTGNFVANKREVIVVPEIVSNSLIISALPSYYSEVIQVIENFDRRPPMVKVKVTLAEVNLNALEEFGVEIGIQDSLLFDRGQSLGNPLSTALLTTGENLAGTARSAFGVGTVGAGFGGFTLSAGNESLNLLMRSLKDRNCVRVLSRPHLMTIENLQGRITVGANVPRVTGTTITNGLAQTNVDPIDVGVTLEVTPRVSPDGMIVMFVNAINSSLADAGIAVGTDANGNAIESPIINQTAAQTTVMGRSGQTIVLSGLIQETKSKSNRGVPILSGLPILGPLFGFQSDEATRSELLIIMTPELVLDDETLRQQNNEEMDRMHWCMCDVAEVHGNTGYNGNPSYQAPNTYYPDTDPSGLNPVRPQFESEPVQGAPQTAPGSVAPRVPMQLPQSRQGRSTNRVESARTAEVIDEAPAKKQRRSLFKFR